MSEGGILIVAVLLSSCVASVLVTGFGKDDGNEVFSSAKKSKVKSKSKDCVYGKWSEWSRCVHGKRKRTRTVTAQEGAKCEPSEEERVCGCIGVWEDDENGCKCGHATKKQTFRRLTHELTQQSCVAADGGIRYVKCTQPSWCPTPSPSVASPPASAVPTVSKTATPDCVGYWEDDSIGCNCNGVKKQKFRVAKPENEDGVPCKSEYTRNVGCTPLPGCTNA
jgi:hypothetical protein